MREMVNVDVFFDSHMGVDEVLEVGADHVAIATGATWLRDRFDGEARMAVSGDDSLLFTPDDILAGRRPEGRVIVYDEDAYYMGSAMAEMVRASGAEVTLITPREVISDWAGKTSERWRIRAHLMGQGIDCVTSQALIWVEGGQARLSCQYTGAGTVRPCDTVVMVTQRAPSDTLYRDLIAHSGDPDALPFTLRRIGDCEAPAIIAAAVYAGHRYARELDTTPDIDEPLKHDRVDVGQTPEGAHLSKEASR
jgi:dimethylamine/trimethylamine dehydrogenase